MRLLLVKRENKKRAGLPWRVALPKREEKIIIIAVKMWKATHKGGGKERKKCERLYVNGVAFKALLIPIRFVNPRPNRARDGTNFMIITLILLCCSLVWCKELFSFFFSCSSLWVKDLGIIIKQIN